MSGPVGAPHRRKVPRTVAVGLIVFVILLAVAVPAYLFLPAAGRHKHLVRQVREFAAMFGINLQNDAGSPASMLANMLRRPAGGILGLFGTAIFVVAGLMAALFLAVYLAASPEPVVGWRGSSPERRPVCTGSSWRSARACCAGSRASSRPW